MSSVAASMAAMFLWLRPANKLESETSVSKAAPAASKPAQKKGPVEYPDINTLRNAIPAHCFQPKLTISFAYLARDIILILALAWAALTYIPSIDNKSLRWTAWAAYGFAQGCACTGLWILAHECGHGAFSLNRKVNNIVGWAAHSALLVPYYSWKFSHARHHRFTGHMEKDMAFVPRTEEEHAGRFWAKIGVDEELFEDAPIVALVRLITHQLVGWQGYLIFNVTAGSKSLQPDGKQWGVQSHFDPTSAVFRGNERWRIAMSDLGVMITAAAIYYGVTQLGGSTMFLLYAVPYLWVHHWLVAITYLHHTHPDLPHFDADNWAFVKGALSTVDRDFGFIGRYLFHGIIETHVVHHLFSKIPFYYQDEATAAIKPILGDLYHSEDGFVDAIWPTFTECKYVVPDASAGPGEMHWAHTVKKNE